MGMLRWLPVLLATAWACTPDDELPPFTGDPVVQDGGVADAAPPATDAGSHDASAPLDAADAEAPKEAIHYVGRFDVSDPAGPRFQWSASSIVTRFSGTGIGVRLKGDANQFAVVVDGQETRLRFDGATESNVLATALPAGEHSVELHKRTEAEFGSVQFLGFDVEGGALVPTVFPYAHRLEIIGDSISCGYGIEGPPDGNCGFSQETENEHVAYGALTARALGAAHTTIAWSGRGMYRNCCGDDLMTGILPQLYDRTLPSDVASVWDFSRWTPEVVVVNLGTNDFATGDPGQPYVDAYVAFLVHLRTVYPAAQIFGVMGSMQNSPEAHTEVQAAVTARNAAGDANVHYVQFAAQDGATDGFGCGAHPSVVTAQKMAAVLTAAIHDVTGW